MFADEPNNPFEFVREFEWDDTKRNSNLLKHGIDFSDVDRIFDGDVVIGRSDRDDEVRYEVFGILDRVVIAAACTIRKDRCRLDIGKARKQR
jgi:uncharacterized protein